MSSRGHVSAGDSCQAAIISGKHQQQAAGSMATRHPPAPPPSLFCPAPSPALTMVPGTLAEGLSSWRTTRPGSTSHDSMCFTTRPVSCRGEGGEVCRAERFGEHTSHLFSEPRRRQRPSPAAGAAACAMHTVCCSRLLRLVHCPSPLADGACLVKDMGGAARRRQARPPGQV
jgi:hypothetical protein